MIALIPFKCLSSFMGCGVSKFDIADDGSSYEFRPVHRRNDRVVVDICLLPNRLPEGDKGEEHAKGDDIHQQMNGNKGNSSEEGGIPREKVKREDQACDNEDNEEDGHDRDDILAYPGSPSFRDYCNTVSDHSDDDISEGDSNAGKIKEEQVGRLRNSKKGSRNRLGKRGRIGRGLKTGSAKVKRILRV